MATTLTDLQQRILNAQGVVPGARQEPGEEPDQFPSLTQRILAAQGIYTGAGQPRPFPIGVGAAFMSGVGEGLTDFLTIAGVDYEGPEAVTGGEKVAKGIGHLAGLIGAYVPFSYGTGFAMRGLGLAQKMSPEAFRFAQTTLAFGLQEFGAGEDVPEGIKRGLMGAAFAGGIEGLLLAKRIRSVNKKQVRLDDGAEYVIPPDLVNLHRQLNIQGTDNPQVIIDKLVALGDEAVGYQEAAAALGNLYAPNGLSIIEGLTDPKKFAAFVLKENPQAKIYTRSSGITSRVPKKGEQWVATDGAPHSFDMLIHDTRYASRLERVAARDPRLKETVRLLGEGESIPLNDAYELLLTDVPGEMLPTPNLFRLSRRQMQERGAKGKGATYFEHNTPSGEIELLIETGGKDFAELGVLTHEYSHGFTSVWDTTLGRRRTGTLQEVFGEIAPFTQSVTREGVITDLARAGSSHPNHPLVRQLRRAQEEVLTITYNQGQGIPWPKARQLAREDIRQNAKYFDRDDELTAWLFELMLLDPKAARKYAPQAVNILKGKIQADSPKLVGLMSRKGRGFSEAMGLRWVEDDAGKRMWQVLAPVRMTEKQVRNWKAYGMVDGMEIPYGELQEPHVILKTVAGAGRDKNLNMVQLKNLRTGTKFAVDRSKVTRPTYPRLAPETERVAGQIEGVLSRRANWIGFVRGNADGSFQRGVVDLKNFARAESFVKYFEQHKAAILQGKKINTTKDMRNEVMRHIRASGQEGLVLEEGGIVTEIFPVSQKNIFMGEKLSAQFDMTVDAVGVIPNAQRGSDIVRIVPSFRNRVTSVLRDAGVPEREIEWFVDISKRIEQKSYKGMLEDEVIQAHQRALEAQNKAVQEAFNMKRFNIEIVPLEAKAAEVGAKIDDTMEGAYRILAEDGSVIARVNTEREAEALLSKIGPDDAARKLDDGRGATTEGMGPGLAAPKEKPGSSIPADWENTVFDLSKRRRFIHGWRTGVAKIVTPIGSVFRSIEALGKGPAWSKIYEPTQMAFKQMDNWLAAKKWDALGKQTIIEAAELVDRTVAHMLPARRRVAMKLDEFLTREEIAAPGGFLDRAASIHELEAARSIGDLGAGRFSDEVLNYVKLNQLIDDGVGNATRMRNKIIPEIEGRISRGQVDPEFQRVLDMYKRATLEAESREATIATMNLSADEAAFLDKISVLMEQHMMENADFKMNIFMVARLAAAKPAAKMSKADFIRLNAVTAEERQMVSNRAKILDTVFSSEGISRTQMMKGQMPVLRKANEYGIHIDNKLFQVEEMEGVRKWIGSRLKSGGVNPHDYEPYVTMMRHVQNINAGKHLDPIWAESMEWAKRIAAEDPRLGRIVSEYMEEVRGIGHDSFERLNTAIQQMVRTITGKELPPDVGERFVNTLLKFGYQASIPFRPALVMRNAFQMQLSLPYLGPEAWYKGFRKSISDKGFIEALRAHAIDPNAYPLASSKEAFGVASQGKLYQFLSEKYSTEFADAVVNAGHGWDDFMRMGLDWYRKPDDFGRALAYFGTGEKMVPAMKVYRAGVNAGKSVEAMEQLKKTMKSNWFGEVVDAEFERLVLADGTGKDAAAFLGRQLADKTHFLYGHANHPTGWRSVPGRLFGQFGTFPAQYLDYALDAVTTQTAREAAGYWSYNAVMNAGVIAAGAAVGVNLKSWAIIPSLQYTGGPYADLALSMVNIVGGSDLEQKMAARNIMLAFPFEVDWDDKAIRFENPESPWVPLSYAIGDWEDAFGQDDLFKGLLTGLGFQFIKR